MNNGVIMEKSLFWLEMKSKKQQYQLPVNGRDVLQTRWSFDSRFLAIRFEDSIEIYKIE